MPAVKDYFFHNCNDMVVLLSESIDLRALQLLIWIRVKVRVPIVPTFRRIGLSFLCLCAESLYGKTKLMIRLPNASLSLFNSICFAKLLFFQNWTLLITVAYIKTLIGGSSFSLTMNKSIYFSEDGRFTVVDTELTGPNIISLVTW